MWTNVMFSSAKHLALKLIVENVPVSSSSCEKLLEIKIDQKLPFEPHVECRYIKASQKLNVLSRMASALKFER